MPNSAKYQYLKSLGLCTCCGKVKATDGIYCHNCKITFIDARPKTANGKMVFHEVSKRLLGGSGVPNGNAATYAKILGKTEAWVKAERKRLTAIVNAEAATIVKQPSAKPVVAEADRERFQNLYGPAVKQAQGIVSQERNKPQEARQSQNIWLTEIEVNAVVVANDWKCPFCGCKYGTHVYLGGTRPYEVVLPEQMHVTKTHKAGGTKEDVRVGCGICNDIHGNGEGMSEADLKTVVTKTWSERGYRNVKLIEVAA